MHETHVQSYYTRIQCAKVCGWFHMLMKYFSLYKYICHEHMYILSKDIRFISDHMLFKLHL